MGRGYEGKFRLALRQAHRESRDGVLALLDTDKDKKRSRLAQLHKARTAHEAKSAPRPTATGEADPHAEAWLLDDADAVRKGLELDLATETPTIAKAESPKRELERLYSESPKSEQDKADAWRAIAHQLDPSNCQHARATGLTKFLDDIQREFVASTASPNLRTFHR